MANEEDRVYSPIEPFSQIHELKEENKRLREALKEIEYINKICPFCFYKEGDGHMEDCQLVILEVVEEGGGE